MSVSWKRWLSIGSGVFLAATAIYKMTETTLPRCSDPAVIETTKQAYLEIPAIKNSFGSRFSITDFEGVITQNKLPSGRGFSCSATIQTKLDGQAGQVAIEYTTEMTDDGQNFYVQVRPRG